MNDNKRSKWFKTRCTPVDRELADRQWSEWRSTRRSLLKYSGFAGGALALSGTSLLSRSSRAAAQDETPKMGGAVSMSLADDDVSSFDPIVPFDNMSIWTMLLIYDQVLRVDAEGTGLEGGLAETWDVSDDNLTYTFHLRETNFHDGTPCTAEDVAFCLDRTVKGEESGWAFLFSAVDKIEATDPQTVVITLTTPWAPLPFTSSTARGASWRSACSPTAPMARDSTAFRVPCAGFSTVTPHSSSPSSSASSPASRSPSPPSI